MRCRTALFVFLLFAIAACAEGESTPVTNDPDSGTGPGTQDGGKGEGGQTTCDLGTPDHCGTCETKCPGLDDTTTVRTCSTTTALGTCDVLCRGEFYDVDGKLENGCEAADQPVQDTEATARAITLQNVPNTDGQNPVNVSAPMYQDARKHEDAPFERPLGREDWFRVTAVGAGDPGDSMKACLSIVNFPADNELEVCISNDAQSTFPPAGCKKVTPASAANSGCVAPSAGNLDTGTFLVRVKKTKGAATANGYALFLKH
jgi:hypothetical protein